jgi:hypothetical protein
MPSENGKGLKWRYAARPCLSMLTGIIQIAQIIAETSKILAKR